MEKTMFMELVNSAMEASLGEKGYDVEVTTSDTIPPYTALMVKKGAGAFPIVNLDKAYAAHLGGETVGNILDKIEDMALKAKPDDGIMEKIEAMVHDRVLFLENVLTRVYRKEVVPAGTPKKPVGETDLVLTMHLAETKGNETFSARVTDSMLETVGITAEEAFEAAMGNTAKIGCIKTMDEVLMGMSGRSYPHLPIKVVSNYDIQFGAATMFADRNAIEQMTNNYGGSYLVIPSSIHEVLTMPADFATRKELTAMIRGVNAMELLEKEILSDHAYLYDAETKTFSNYA